MLLFFTLFNVFVCSDKNDDTQGDDSHPQKISNPSKNQLKLQIPSLSNPSTVEKPYGEDELLLAKCDKTLALTDKQKDELMKEFMIDVGKFSSIMQKIIANHDETAKDFAKDFNKQVQEMLIIYNAIKQNEKLESKKETS